MHCTGASCGTPVARGHKGVELAAAYQQAGVGLWGTAVGSSLGQACSANLAALRGRGDRGRVVGTAIVVPAIDVQHEDLTLHGSGRRVTVVVGTAALLPTGGAASGQQARGHVCGLGKGGPFSMCPPGCWSCWRCTQRLDRPACRRLQTCRRPAAGSASLRPRL